jgi:hypothetical protein
MEVAINHVIAIAEKITRMEVLGEDSLGLGYIKIILSCLIRKKEATIFISNTTKIQNSCSSNIYQRIFSAANSHQGSFLKNIRIRYCRLEIVGKETITDEEIRTNYITLPHFVTLKDEIMRTLQK